MKTLPGFQPLPAREKDWQRTLVEGFEFFKYTVNHVRPGRTGKGEWVTPTTSKGFPDLLCLRGEWLIACEVKGLKTLVETEQIEWLERFAQLPTGRAWILRPTANWGDIVRWMARPADAPRRFGWGEHLSPAAHD
jgi:hypothetical protein